MGVTKTTRRPTLLPARQSAICELVLACWLAVAMPSVVYVQGVTPAAGQIAGRVVDAASSEPLAGVRVFLYPIPVPNHGRIASASTGDDGGVMFSAVGAMLPATMFEVSGTVVATPRPGNDARRVNRDAPFIPVSVVDGDVTGLVVPVPLQ